MLGPGGGQRLIKQLRLDPNSFWYNSCYHVPRSRQQEYSSSAYGGSSALILFCMDEKERGKSPPPSLPFLSTARLHLDLSTSKRCFWNSNVKCLTRHRGVLLLQQQRVRQEELREPRSHPAVCRETRASLAGVSTCCVRRDALRVVRRTDLTDANVGFRMLNYFFKAQICPDVVHFYLIASIRCEYL